MKNAKKIKFVLFGEVFEKNFKSKERAEFFLKCVTHMKASKEPRRVREGFLTYLNIESTKKKKASEKLDRRCLKMFETWLLDQNITILNEIKLFHLENYQAFLLQDYKGSSVNRYFNTIKHCFRKFYQWEYISLNPCDGLRPLESKKKLTVLWTDSDYKKVRGSLKSKESKVLLDLLWETGARISSALKVTPEAIGEGALTLKTQKGPYRHSKLYTVPISKKLQKQLTSLARGEEPIFTLSRHAFSKQIERVRPRLGLTIHGIRHTFATKLDDHGIQLNNIRLLLGHSSTKVTQEYINSNITSLRQSLNCSKKK